MAPASDLVEGLLNNVERPPVFDAHGRELYAGKPLPHFNEVDECAGLDALITNRVWSSMQLDPATTLHDVRWGEHYSGGDIDEFVWVFQISGAVPASHRVIFPVLCAVPREHTIAVMPLHDESPALRRALPLRPHDVPTTRQTRAAKSKFPAA